ncbi:MAG TPA: hypothetical protein VN969_41135 [Streptosporangiaceae bacterium]|nr:hypothetical protein [Streptosporangiaceae bacterium]
MVCYARRATGILSIAIAALFLYGADTAHLFDVAGLLISFAIVLGGAAAASAAVYVSLRSVRRKRALAGGCVSCQLRCQHAMTDFPARRSGGLWLVSTVERRPEPTKPVFVPLPRVPERVRVRAGAPRWPDLPARGSSASAPSAAALVSPVTAPPRPAATAPRVRASRADLDGD